MIQASLHGAEDAHLLHRLDGVLLVAAGRSCCEVADWFGVDRRTVERWVRTASVTGIEGLARHRQPGRPARLEGDQAQVIQQALRSAPAALGYPDRRWTGKRVALLLTKQCGLAMSIRSCQRLIRRVRSASPKAP